MAERARPAGRAPKAASADLNDRSLYVNRELSLLQFQERVLAQALDRRHPLLERVKFLAIVSRNVDEFFMVRVSELAEQAEAGLVQLAPDGMTPVQQLAAIRQRAIALMREMRRIYKEELLPELAEQGIKIVDLQELSASQRAGLRTHFEQDIFPVLTPLAVDPGHPFPHISNLSVSLAVELAGQDSSETRFARVKIPDVIPSLVDVKAVLGQDGEGKKRSYIFVWLRQLVATNLSMLFPGIPVLASHGFRVTRDADIEIHEEEGADLRVSVERGLRQRRFGEAVTMAVEETMPEHMRTMLAGQLDLRPEDVYAVGSPLDVGSLMELTSVDRPDLKYPPFVPQLPQSITAGESILTAMDRHDIMVHHPYDSFAPVVDMLKSASRDPDVLAMKQTLYRVGTDAPVVHALLDAANHGKQVAVLLELKARFDEASNIEWALELERAGAHVVYGLLGLKTHAKIALVVKKDRDGIRRYIHLGTGNYNVGTARAYTDLALFTTNPDFGDDATKLFNALTGYSEHSSYRHFLVAPVNLREELLARIEREIKLHKEDGKGRLIFKMNNLVDPDFIRALYRASQAGVKVDLIVRTICCLRPGIPGVSENIRVISLVGRFLEHSRVYYFRNGGSPDVYAGSADLMQRNLDHRVEVLFPLLDPQICERVVNGILSNQLKDTANAWELQADGSYRRVQPPDGKAAYDSQADNLSSSSAVLSRAG